MPINSSDHVAQWGCPYCGNVMSSWRHNQDGFPRPRECNACGATAFVPLGLVEVKQFHPDMVPHSHAEPFS